MAAAGAPPDATVLVITGDPGEDARSSLAELLGPSRLAALERGLMDGARAWAERVAPGRVGVHEAIGSAALGAAVDRAFAAAAPAGGPVLLIWPVLPLWRSEHADGALGDLAQGCDVTVGPVYDGGFYLVGLARPVAALFTVPDEAWSGPDAMGLVLAVAHQARLEAGMLRAERGLRRAADVRAALADPLVAPELRAILADG